MRFSNTLLISLASIMSINAIELSEIASFKNIVAEGFETLRDDIAIPLKVAIDAIDPSNNIQLDDYSEPSDSVSEPNESGSKEVTGNGASESKEVNNSSSDTAIATQTSAPVLSFDGESVCEKFQTNLTVENSETLQDKFETDIEFYVSQNSSLPDYYYLDFFLKNPNYDVNEFYYVNASNNVADYNPVYISTQGNYGFELRFLTVKEKLCSFLEDFYVFYQLNNTQSSETSHKIWVTGNCTYVEQNNATVYDTYINEGYKCVNYNNGNGEQNWCSSGFESDQCCATYENDEYVNDDSCPSFSGSTTSSISMVTPTFVPEFKGYSS